MRNECLIRVDSLVLFLMPRLGESEVLRMIPLRERKKSLVRKDKDGMDGCGSILSIS